MPLQRKRDDLATSKIPLLLPLVPPIHATVLQRQNIYFLRVGILTRPLKKYLDFVNYPH